MPKWLTAAFVCLLSITLFASQAQTVEEVVNNYVTAMGGKEKLGSIKSLYMQGVAVMQNGTEINTTIYKVQDKLSRTDVSFGMGNISIIITDKQGWRSTPQSAGKYEAMPEEAVKSQQSSLDCTSPLFDYAAKGHKAELLGQEIVNGANAYKIKLTLKTGGDITYFIDAKTWYIVEELRKGGGGMGGGRPGGNADVEVKTDYSDYKKTADGYVFAYTVARSGMGGSMTYEKIDVNQPVDEKLYKPAN